MKTAKPWFVLAGLACVACCAVPLAAIFGIGGVASGAGAWFAGWNAETVFCVATLGGIVIALTYFAVRKRNAQPDCTTSCDVNARCCEQKPNS